MAVQRNRGRKTKEQYDERGMGEGEEGAKMLLEYVKNIGLYYGL
jgi:hypothetical protein